MKTFILIFSVTTALFLYGCGNDSVTNSNNNPPGNTELQIATLDSISLRSNIPVSVDSIIILNFAGIDSIKLTFDFESNFPVTSNLFADIIIMSNDSSQYAAIWSLPNGQNQNESFITGIVPNPTIHNKIFFKLRFTSSSVPEFTVIKLKNIKVFKII